MNDTNGVPTHLKATDHDTNNWQALLKVHEFFSAEREATVTVDAHGRIAHCSAAGAELLGSQVESLIGQPLSQFFDQLPFDPNTPGYNLAYAVFHSAEGRWQRHRVATPDGLRVGVDMAMSSVRMKGRRAIQITLKATDSGQQAHCH